MFIFSIICFLLQYGLWIYVNIKMYLTEAATRSVLWKKVLLQTSQNSQENTCIRAFFNKTAVLRTATLLKKSSVTGAFLWILRNVYEHVISKHPWTTASDFICSKYFIFSIIKNFHHEKSRFVRKKSTSGNPA